MPFAPVLMWRLLIWTLLIWTLPETWLIRVDPPEHTFSLQMELTPHMPLMSPFQLLLMRPHIYTPPWHFLFMQCSFTYAPSLPAWYIAYCTPDIWYQPWHTKLHHIGTPILMAHFITPHTCPDILLMPHLRIFLTIDLVARQTGSCIWRPITIMILSGGSWKQSTRTLLSLIQKYDAVKLCMWAEY